MIVTMMMGSGCDNERLHPNGFGCCCNVRAILSRAENGTGTHRQGVWVGTRKLMAEAGASIAAS